MQRESKAYLEETSESWDENFAYMLDFDDECKITDYQVWAGFGSNISCEQGPADRGEKGPVMGKRPSYPLKRGSVALNVISTSVK
ncbi:hypothetical protein MPER_12410 [Moniliophthora perniciosa FA553]|nr:hypothetical protein MPER_12410 [Moniliophthora perniciosa FA553]